MPKGEKKARYPELAETVRAMIEDGELTQAEAAQRVGLNRTTVGRWAKRFGWKTQRSGPRSGPGHPEWKGGRRLQGRYWYVYSPEHPRCTKQRYVAEHRLVMERKLGRYLEPHEVVHHIDGSPTNNDPSNLIVFQTNAEHLRHDLKGRVPSWSPDGKRRILEAVRKRRRKTRPPT